MKLEAADLITVITQVVVACVTLFGLIYAIRQYTLTKKRFLEERRPFVQIELERIESGLLDLVIRNTGRSVAHDISVKFKPNIILHSHSKIRINSYKFLKNMKFLAPDKSLSFFFGSIIGGKTNICREFEVITTYQDLDGKGHKVTQVIDPRDYLELTSIKRKGIHDVANELEEIRKLLEKSIDNR